MSHFYTRLVVFVSGFFFGVFLAIYTKSTPVNSNNPNVSLFSLTNYNKWFKKKRLGRKFIPFDTLRYSNRTFLTESQFLHDQVDILCVILVKKDKNAKAARESWAKGCNKIHLVDLKTEKKKIPVRRDKNDSSWAILCNNLKQLPEYSWIVIVYDDTFLMLENLRLFLAALDYNDKYYLGHAVKFWSTVYNMGQAGYVLSRGSLKVLKEALSNDCTSGVGYRNQEDYYLGKNLARINISVIDTRDHDGLSTFHPYNLYHAFFPEEGYYRFSVFKHECCSPYSISFQAIEGDKMYTYYYLLYTLQLFIGGKYANKEASKSLPDDEIWKSFLRSRNKSTDVSSAQYYQIWEDLVDDPTSFARHMKREESSDSS